MIKKGDRVTLKHGSSVHLTDVSGEVLEVHPSYMYMLGDQSGQWVEITVDDIEEIHESKKGVMADETLEGRPIMPPNGKEPFEIMVQQWSAPIPAMRNATGRRVVGFVFHDIAGQAYVVTMGTQTANEFIEALEGHRF